MREIIVHKINQVIHIAILLKGDIPTRRSSWPHKISVYLTSSLFKIKCPHSVITRRYAFHTICKEVMFLSFIQFASYNNSQCIIVSISTLSTIRINHCPHITSINKYTQKSCFKNSNEVILLLQSGLPFKMWWYSLNICSGWPNNLD